MTFADPRPPFSLPPRLFRTIIEFDKVLVLDRGNVVEYDSPKRLLDDPNSRFYAMCRAAGRSEFKLLKRMANGKAISEN